MLKVMKFFSQHHIEMLFPIPKRRVSHLRSPDGARMGRFSVACFAFGAFGLAMGGLAWAAIGAPTLHVSQKGRAFQPNALILPRGAKVEIVNDDGDLLHHVYVDAPDFTFDSGDLKPGSRTLVAFTVGGTFAVLCGIHPKMKLTVRVEKP
jgi:plastocyanin